MLLQRSFDANIEWRLEIIQGFVLQEDLYQLLQPAINKRPYMYDSFIIGNLHQVSRYTYGLYIKSIFKNGQYLTGNSSEVYLSFKNYDGDETIVPNNKVMIVIRKG